MTYKFKVRDRVRVTRTDMNPTTRAGSIMKDYGPMAPIPHLYQVICDDTGALLFAAPHELRTLEDPNQLLKDIL